MTRFLCYFWTILLDQLSHGSVLKLTVGETMEAGGRVGWVCVFTQLSSGLTQVSLHKYHTHTLSPTVDMMCVQSHSCIPRYFTYRAWLSSLDRRGECDLKIDILIAVFYCVCNFKRETSLWYVVLSCFKPWRRIILVLILYMQHEYCDWLDKTLIINS